jgi:anthranilate synthase component 1
MGKVTRLINSSGKLDSFIFKNTGVNKTSTEHKNMVLEAKKHIVVGDIFQTVLSFRTNYKILGDKRRIYAVLRRINPSPYMMYFKFGQREIITASPELLIRVKGKTIEHFGTLAGTIRKGKNEEEDRKLAQQLKKDEKEMAEHMMLVDLARNDVGRICEFGSITVANMATVKKYSHVQHLYSEIRGKLKRDENAFSALAACFPAGTLTGAPKIEAMKIISQLEGIPRGPYGGVGGFFSINGDSMLAIIIRSILINSEKAYTQTGSGIVFDSKPKREFEEIHRKQKAMEEALELTAI